jgi:hypothetical protein
MQVRFTELSIPSTALVPNGLSECPQMADLGLWEGFDRPLVIEGARSTDFIEQVGRSKTFGLDHV